MVAVGKGVEVAVGTVGVTVGVGGMGVTVGVDVGGTGVLVGVAVGARVGIAIFPPTTAPAPPKPITLTIPRMATRLPRVYPINVRGLMPSSIKTIVPVITITARLMPKTTNPSGQR